MMNFYDKYFSPNTTAGIIKQEYDDIALSYKKPGIYQIDNLSDATSIVFTSKDKGYGSVTYLVEDISTRENFVGTCIKISYEKNNVFYCVSKSTFTQTTPEHDILGPITTFEGFSINDRNEVEALDTDDAQIKLEWGLNAIDMVYQDTQSFALVKEQ